MKSFFALSSVSEVNSPCPSKSILDSALLNAHDILSDGSCNWTCLQFLVNVNFMIFSLELNIFHRPDDDCCACAETF